MAFRRHGRYPADDLAKPLPADRPWNGVTSKAGFAEADPRHIHRFIFARVEGRWKLHLVQDDGVTTDRQLYDLKTDPGETTNRLAESRRSPNGWKRH